MPFRATSSSRFSLWLLTATGCLIMSGGWEAAAQPGADYHPSGLTFSTTSVAMSEGDNAVYTVVLDEQPPEPVMVTVVQPMNPDVKVDTDPSTSGNQKRVSFTTTNWNTPQTVTISAVEDVDAVDEEATIEHAASYNGRPGRVSGYVQVSVADSDTVTEDVGTVDINERRPSVPRKPSQREASSDTRTMLAPPRRDSSVSEQHAPDGLSKQGELSFESTLSALRRLFDQVSSDLLWKCLVGAIVLVIVLALARVSFAAALVVSFVIIFVMLVLLSLKFVDVQFSLIVAGIIIAMLYQGRRRGRL